MDPVDARTADPALGDLLVRPVALALSGAGEGRRGTWDLAVEPVRPWHRVWWDTADWRLLRHGLALELTGAPRGERLVLHGDSAVPATCRVPSDLPRALRPQDLPEGRLRTCLEERLGLRALLPLARCSGEVRRILVLDERRKTVARLEIRSPGPRSGRPVEDGEREGAGQEVPGGGIRLLPVRGYEAHARAVARELGSAGLPVLMPLPAQRTGDAAARVELGQAEEAFLVAGLRPGVLPGEPAVPVGPDTPAGVATAAMLLGFLDQIRAATDGTVEDVDTEFLHDLRVAVRRSRSALKLAGDALPPGLPGRLSPGLAWLGDLTTPVRDLDVHLLLLPGYRERLVASRAEDLDPLHAHLVRERTLRRRALVRGLRSGRYDRLCSTWRAELEAVVEGRGPEAAGTPAGLPFAALAAERIARAERTVLRKGRRISPGCPAEHLHSLRKRCKELRYLVQLFERALDPGAVRVVTRHLKGLQEILGRFQDCEVQRQALRAHAERMSRCQGPAGAPAVTLMAVGELAGSLAREQEEVRAGFADRFARFDSPRVHRHVVRSARSGRDGGTGGRDRGPARGADR